MLTLHQMDEFESAFGIDPRRFSEMPKKTMWEIIDSLDMQIESGVLGTEVTELFTAVQAYALKLVDWLPPDYDAVNPEKPTVKLIGEDGNVFNIIGITKRALSDWDWERETTLANDFMARVEQAHSYDEILRTVMDFANVR